MIDPIALLLQLGWSVPQARGIITSIGPLPWGPHGNESRWRATHLNDWCSAHGHDKTTPEGQLRFVSHDLLNTFVGRIGGPMKAAENAYVTMLKLSPYALALANGEMKPENDADPLPQAHRS